MSRRYVDGLLSYRDKELFLGAVYELVGFKQIPLLVTKESTSETTYTFKRKLILLGNALTSFSAFPLMMMFWGGLLMSFFAFVFIIYVVIKWIVISARPGWTSLIASIWLVGGLQMLSIGTIGLYLKKVLEEVKDRPYTVIKEVYENSKTNG